MKDTFNTLKEWLQIRQDSYWYEDVQGNACFDMLALMCEVDSFAAEFEKQIH